VTAIIVALLAVSSAMAIAAQASRQDKYTLTGPNGVAFSDIRGYETWPAVAVSSVESEAGVMGRGMKLIVANPTMIDAYKAGIPGNGKPFPDGSKIVKIEWLEKDDPESPYSVMVPAALRRVGFIEKDSKRFPETNGWGYAQFTYHPATATFTPEETDPAFGKEVCHACHVAVAAKDYTFTAYPPR
jgi:Cytochrome P460